MTDTVTVQNPKGGTNTIPVPANCAAVVPPSQDMLDPAKFAVNVAGVMEAITQPLYSYQAYPAAGSANPLTFFQSQPVGTITAEDTNMQLAGQLPAPQKFLIQGIGVDFISGNAVAKFGAEVANGNLNDFYAVMKRGLLTLTIGSKNYLQMTSLLQLPPRSHINGGAAVADATTAAAALQTMIQFGFSDGDTFKPRPLLIEASQNFQVSIAYPGGAVAIPSADAAARIGVILYGTLYRPAQ
jgi:hypothetical protein